MMPGLVHRATVYTQNGSGLYSTVVTTDLRCLFDRLNSQPATSGPERAELAAIRNLIWEAPFVMPESAQVEDAASVRWNVVAGTIKDHPGVNGAWHHSDCDLVRAVDG